MGLRIGGISFGGISSGLPTDQIIEGLLKLERRPIDLLETRKTSFEEKLKIFQDLNTKTRTLRDRLRELDNLNLLGSGTTAFEEFSALTASSNDTTIATATADGSASPGSITVEVAALARSSRHVSQNFTALTDSIATGTFSITVGGEETEITIDNTNNTVQGFINAINSAGADVSAFVINDGSASPFIIGIQGKSTGTANDVVLDTSGLSGMTLPTFNESQNAQNAQLILDPNGGSPITILSSTNTFTDVVAGVDVVAKKVSSDEVVIEIESDVDALVDRIASVVEAFNDVFDVIAEQFKIDPGTNRGGPLIGDSTLSNLQRALQSAIARDFGDGAIQTAGEIGISFGDNNRLELDEADLRSALSSNFNAVRAFFTGQDGFADTLRSATDNAVDVVDGSLIARIEGTNSTITDIDEQIVGAERRIDRVEESLVRQFAALERTVSQIQIQGNFLSQFVLQSQNR